MNDCNSETQVCLDLPPPSKWQCVERTPAPTPAPTISCINDKVGKSLDRGCTHAKPFCVANFGSAGLDCAFCINDGDSSDDDTGCDFSKDCVNADGTEPPRRGAGTRCTSRRL